MFRGSDDTSNTAKARGPLSAMAHVARCGPSKSPDRVRVCESCIRDGNLSYLQGNSPDCKNRSLNSIEGIGISSHKPHIQQS
jgi:hypothetical protein